jgi:hypothetical protein
MIDTYLFTALVIAARNLSLSQTEGNTLQIYKKIRYPNVTTLKRPFTYTVPPLLDASPSEPMT